MKSYATYDTLPDLSAGQMGSATHLSFAPYTPTMNGLDWDASSSYNTARNYAILYDTFSFTLVEGVEYDLYSVSFFDPYVLRLFDDKGNTIAFDDGSGPYGVDHIGFVAPYTGTYYAAASWNQGLASTNKAVNFSVYADSDSADIGRVFNWAESAYSWLFPDHPQTTIQNEVYVRMYSNGNELGELDGNIYFFDAFTQEISMVGQVDDYMHLAVSAGF